MDLDVCVYIHPLYRRYFNMKQEDDYTDTRLGYRRLALQIIFK